MILSELAMPPVPSFGAYPDPHRVRAVEKGRKKANTLIYYLFIHVYQKFVENKIKLLKS
jgi:hypothetical protein